MAQKSRGIQATKKDIGMLAIPLDNSFCIQIPGCVDSELVGKTVVIRTRPVKLKVRGSRKGSRLIEREFVFVTLGGVQYRVLNCFSFIERIHNWVGSNYLVVEVNKKNLL